MKNDEYHLGRYFGKADGAKSTFRHPMGSVDDTSIKVLSHALEGKETHQPFENCVPLVHALEEIDALWTFENCVTLSHAREEKENL